MAFLGGTFDANSVEPSAPMEVLPPGKYSAQIIESEMRETRSGGQMLKITMEVMDGPSKGRKIWDNLNLVNSNPQAQEIAHRTLSAICHAVGKLQVQDSEELHFRPMLVTVEVGIDDRDKALPPEEQRKQNRVKGYSSMDGSTAPRAASGPRTNAAPPPSAQAKPASAAPPWRK
jgi:hypothetical protein